MTVVPRAKANEQVDAFIALYRQLNSAAGSRILARDAITMRAAAPYAAYMTIVELVSDESWIVRLNGTGHCESAKSTARESTFWQPACLRKKS